MMQWHHGEKTPKAVLSESSVSQNWSNADSWISDVRRTAFRRDVFGVGSSARRPSPIHVSAVEDTNATGETVLLSNAREQCENPRERELDDARSVK